MMGNFAMVGLNLSLGLVIISVMAISGWKNRREAVLELGVCWVY
jgi:hypothetical protein